MKTRKQKRMEKIVRHFQEYVASYSKQMCYHDYSDETFIHNILYGIGIAFDEKQFRMADGYDKWKKKLVESVLKEEAQQQLEPDKS